MDADHYREKLTAMGPRTLLPLLPPGEAEFVRQIASDYRFTFQELRLVAQAGRDLEMWQEGPLRDRWDLLERTTTGVGRERKKKLLRRLGEHLDTLRGTEKAYPASGPQKISRRAVRLVEAQTADQVFGLCPAYSDATVCCGLHTLDAVRGCPFSCSYCTIQTFYGEEAELEIDLLEKLDRIELDPSRRYHIGTGQASDSLVWGNRGGVLDALVRFASDHPNVLLELKTKSDNVATLRELEVPANLVCSWTLNTETVIRNEEVGTAGLERRLAAARSVADRGIPIAFHFHPMVYYAGWRHDYLALADTVRARFTPEEIAFISLGTVTFIKPVVQEIRRRGDDTKILQMPMVSDHHGKLTYPDDIKIELFRALYSAFEPWSDRVFFYLCMETASIWRQVLGTAYPTNAEFEQDFLDRCLPTAPAASAARSTIRV